MNKDHSIIIFYKAVDGIVIRVNNATSHIYIKRGGMAPKKKKKKGKKKKK
jgi:hypothetical protein